MNIIKIAVAIATFALAGTTFAHEPGNTIIRVGVIHIEPDDVFSDDTTVGATATWIVAPHFGVELLATVPFKHNIKIRGWNVGTAKQVSPTISAQYFFLNPQSKIQPYVGAGINYTHWYDESESGMFYSLEVDDSFGLALQAGADYQITDRLSVNATLRWFRVDTKVKARGPIVRATADGNVDPWLFSAGVGYKF